MPLSPKQRLVAAGTVCLVAAGLGVAGLFLWRARSGLPAPGSPRYEEYVEAFEVGTAALDSGLWPEAIERLTSAVELVPQEPAAWANRGLVHLRSGQDAKARPDLERAAQLAPSDPDILEMLGLLSEREGQLDKAIEFVRRASDADPTDVRKLYQLVSLADKQGATGDEERGRQLDKILALRPTSLPVLVERLRVAVRRSDRAAIDSCLNRLGRLASTWDARAQEALAKASKEARGKFDERDLVISIGMLGNVLKAEPGYSRSALELDPGKGQNGRSLQQFVRLAPLKTEPSPPDLDLWFPAAKLLWRPEVDAGKERWDVIAPVWLNGNDTPAVMLANSREVRRGDAAGPALPFPSGGQPPTIDGVLAIDWDNDHATDFLLSGAGGLRFHKQESNASFKDVTDRTKLPADVLKGDYWGAWAADLDLDGDLDVILASRNGGLSWLRNNGDGSFLAQPLFPEVNRARSFRWVDIDNDGAPDAILLDAEGRLHVYMNERAGLFRRRPPPEEEGRYHALAVIDANDDGTLDVAALRQDGTLARISDADKGRAWEVRDLARLKTEPPLAPGEARLVAVDLDNNGAVDLVLRTPRGGVAWLSDGRGEFAPLAAEVPPGLADVVSLECNEHQDFLGTDPAGKLVRWRTQGTKGYHWHRIRPRANPKGEGDQRLNSFAIGSEVELRAGSLIVKQPVDRPVVHFGLGSRSRVSVTRCHWTTGLVQYEFDKPADAVIRIEQRLIGSCPFLFTQDGEKVVFVTDFCWSTPLGLYINSQKRGGGFAETTEWVRIRGDQLRPRDGVYDVRVNANLWETHFLDQLSLTVVDHPPGTEVYCDERFFLTPTKPRLYLTDPPKPVARALDHEGQDVTDVVRAVDGRYLDRAGRGLFQGVTRDHWVEIDLGENAPKEGPVYLLAHGWLHPTDSSINAALEQSSHPRPQPLSLEVPDGQGGWKVAQPALGFPAGKNKTVVLRLDGLDGPGVARRFRLRTNLEVFWDALHYARGLDPAAVVAKTLTPRTADLRYRGILKMSRADASSPEVPHYDQIEHGRQHWRDLIGYHTRFGDVRELVEKADDRYVILNSGDEIALEFDAPLPPPAGWRRDFVWVSDGWTKDGNLNTRWSKTVLPLPYHGMPSYDTPPGRLEDDPAYRKNPKDWQTYHTRYVTPADFERGLRRPSKARP
ncbi:MAG: FG-GAP-like repeat-containing protein [Gemmataceae bacterium]